MSTATTGLRAGCTGIVTLDARLEPWQRRVCRQPGVVRKWLAVHGSPLNILDPSPMARNAGELRSAAAEAGVDLAIYFARKANKALCFVDEAHRLGHGVDLAGERELAQVLQRGVPGSALVMTAAVKPAPLLALCISSGTTVAVDNADELALLAALAAGAATPASVALRLAPDLGEERPQTRFGLGLQEAIALVDDHWREGAAQPTLRIDGVHFHLDGYDPGDRVIALGQALELVDALRHRGHCPSFIDIGGGIPMSYLESAAQWEQFWSAHREGLLGRRAPLTFGGHGLGLLAHAGEILGRPAVYPFHQRQTRGAWLAAVLAGRAGGGAPEQSIAGALRQRALQLRCEPGRALLDGCGLTAARIAYRKQRRDGTWLIGVEMNRTQCRSTSEDFLVDPLLIEAGGGERTGAIEGYLVGAYCIERELLTWRRMRFPHGVAVGDIVVFPNTAGYLMHILESSSHQIPLARNLVLEADGGSFLDPIDIHDRVRSRQREDPKLAGGSSHLQSVQLELVSGARRLPISVASGYDRTLMSGDETRSVEQEGGSLLAQISNEFVTMQKEFWGLGPVQAKSYMMDDLLLVVMRGGTTRAERTMLDFGQQDLVRTFRQTFENEMTKHLTDKIERLTGRKVLTYQSQILFEPDIVAELFVFDKAADGGAAEIVATAEGQLRERPHGEINDDTGGATPDAPTDEPGSTPEQP